MSRTTNSAGEATIAVAKNATSALRVTKADFPDYTIYVDRELLRPPVRG